MDKLIDWLQSLPKAVLVFIGVAFVSLFGYVIYRSMFAPEESPQTEEGSVILDFPDAEDEGVSLSKLEELKRSGGADRSVNEYWESLKGEDGSAGDGGLKPSSDDGDGSGRDRGDDVYLDPSVYSELEIHNIRSGVRTKEEVDASHREDEAIRRQMAEHSASRRVNSDSVMFARMEKAYRLAEKYSSKPEKPDTAAAAAAPAAPAEPEPRRLELSGESSLRTTVLNQEDIICSLDGPASGGGDIIDDLNLVPVKATFLKNETVVTGQKVTMRLLQDLTLSNGTVIPANTHVSGICDVRGRLNVSVKTVTYNGKIYYTHLDVFDMDGTEGIYCPVIVTSAAGKAGKGTLKNVGRELASLAGSAASVINPYVGRISRSAAGQISQAIDNDGNVSVNVCSGYEFYIFENVEKNKDK